MGKPEWQLQTAKAEFSRLVDECEPLGPQVVTRHGKPAAVVMSFADYERLRKKAPDFKKFLLRAPLHELDLTRSQTGARRVVF